MPIKGTFNKIRFVFTFENVNKRFLDPKAEEKSQTEKRTQLNLPKKEPSQIRNSEDNRHNHARASSSPRSWQKFREKVTKWLMR